MIHKLAIGTAQFGMDYGISNSRGQVSTHEVGKILQHARKSGISCLDTAYAYGNSESVIGESGAEGFQIISKLPECKGSEVQGYFRESLNRLKVKGLYGYLIHNVSHFKGDMTIWDELQKLKSTGKLKKAGFSLYTPEEMEMLWGMGISPDIVQVPYNLFDRRFERVFEKMKEKKVEIHVRSIFLQGLFFKLPHDIPSHFEEVKDKLHRILEHRRQYQISVPELCFGFLQGNGFVDKIVVGIDSFEQLRINLNALTYQPTSKEQDFLNTLREDRIDIINPSLWKL